jgi:hypothetical protein
VRLFPVAPVAPKIVSFIAFAFLIVQTVAVSQRGVRA